MYVLIIKFNNLNEVAQYLTIWLITYLLSCYSKNLFLNAIIALQIKKLN